MQQLKDSRLQPDVITYGALADAYSKAKPAQWQKAVNLNLLQVMRRDQVEPSVTTYTAVIDACGKAQPAQWQQAVHLLQLMESTDVKPNATTYSAAISACCNGKQHHQALRLYDQMKAAGIKPDDITYGALIDGLQAAGLEQAADAIYAVAVSNTMLQHWSVKSRNAGMLDLHDFTTGPAMAAMRVYSVTW